MTGSALTTRSQEVPTAGQIVVGLQGCASMKREQRRRERLPLAERVRRLEVEGGGTELGAITEGFQSAFGPQSASQSSGH